jgi:hypothetical protein
MINPTGTVLYHSQIPPDISMEEPLELDTPTSSFQERFTHIAPLSDEESPKAGCFRHLLFRVRAVFMAIGYCLSAILLLIGSVLCLAPFTKFRLHSA